MMTPVPPLGERERERERVNKILFGLIIFVGILLYAGLNVWIYRYTKSGRALSPAEILRSLTQLGTTGSGGFPSNGTERIPPPTPRATPTPTPRPKGPGEYACSPEGVCNLYSDETRKQYCAVTYADSLCLDQCGDKEKQCAK